MERKKPAAVYSSLLFFVFFFFPLSETLKSYKEMHLNLHRTKADAELRLETPPLLRLGFFCLFLLFFRKLLAKGVCGNRTERTRKQNRTGANGEGDVVQKIGAHRCSEKTEGERGTFCARRC